MIQQFQVGDIVRVNKPTPEDFAAMEFAGFTYDCDHLVGKLAMVYLIEEVETTLVGLIPCDEDYEFKIHDLGNLSYDGLGFGIASHLSLVRESELRTYVLTETAQLPLVNQPIPLSGTRMSHRMELPNNRVVETDNRIIEKDAVVGKIYKQAHPNGIMVVFHNPREDDVYIVVSPRELRPPFTVF